MNIELKRRLKRARSYLNTLGIEEDEILVDIILKDIDALTLKLDQQISKFITDYIIRNKDIIAKNPEVLTRDIRGLFK